MTALILRAALWCLLLAAPLVQAAQSAPVLLWLTSDITTAPRTAMVQRLASEAGLGFVHIDYPLGGPAVLDVAQAQKLERALAGAAKPASTVKPSHSAMTRRGNTALRKTNAG